MPDIKEKLLVEDADGRILLVRNRKTQLWALPGGKKHKGEKMQETLDRELSAELPGMQFAGVAYLMTFVLESKDRVSIFTAAGYSGTHKVVGDELDMAIFAGNVAKFRMTKGTAEILRRINSDRRRGAA